MREFLLAAVGLAAIGTVADVVPLIDENRILVRHGLVSLRERPVPGIAALMRVTGLDQKPEIGGEDVAFTLAPRLNAAGRLGQAQLGVELLTTDSTDRAVSLAEYIDQLNNSRDTLERSVYQAACKQIKERFDPETDPALVVDGVGWHPGVLGIVAGRLTDRFNLPVVVIAWDNAGVKPGVGSCRTARGLDLHQALLTCNDHLMSCGGHSQAAGLKLERANIEAFRADFCEHTAEMTSQCDRIAEICIDAEAALSQLTLRTMQEIEQLAPFGQGNPRPILCASDVSLCGPPRRIGNGERHLSLKLKQHGASMRAVAFGQGEAAEEIAQVEGGLDVAFKPVINDFRGRRSVEMHLVDWRPTHAPLAASR
jgi:single-stranded-DNA-specific exonuclease